MPRRKVDERAEAALRWMRAASSLHDYHSTTALRAAMGVDTPSACSAAMKELHDRSLVEPGRRSMWRLTARGRDLSVPYDGAQA